MRIGRQLLLPIVFVGFACLALLAAVVVVGAIERRTAQEVRTALTLEGQEWVEVEADGLQLRLSGLAETEAQRFRALSAAGTVIDAARIIDAMEVRPAAELQAPDFSVELLRNDDGISLIGLIPAAEDREAVVAQLAELSGGDGSISDMLETANYPMPEGWDAALDFGLAALGRLPRSKISITPERVTITAITSSADEKARLESELARQTPPGLRLTLDLSAPRPVIAPFTLRFLVDAGGARFDACSAETEQARTRILAAAVAAGAEGKSSCTIGLGSPSPRWSEAVEAGIAALAELGAGSLTFSDADVSLVAAETVAQGDFDRVVGELERRLPDAFSLTAVLTPKADNAQSGPPEFSATLADDGQIVLRGRLPDDGVRSVVDSYAAARFGAGRVYDATRLDAELPAGWPVRVLTGLEALDELSAGSVLVRPDLVRITGRTGSPAANAEIARLLAAKLGEGAQFEIAVTYEAQLDPAAGLPSPEECAARVNGILADRKITFAPSSAEIEGEAVQTLDLIAEALEDCSEVAMEIGAHSDSQGREEMNLSLSQERADAVLNGLLARRVLTSNLTAVGYGEAKPIADNGTEDGREANRRIEFTLVLPEEEGVAGDAASNTAGAGAGAAAPPATGEAATESPAAPADGASEGGAEGAAEEAAAEPAAGD
jgi:OOP family OmpA-OmpF porin